MEKKDLLLVHLREDARQSLTDISKKTHCPISTLFDRLKSYQKRQIITKHTTLVNFPALGFHCRATIILKVERDHREEVRSILLKQERINSLYKINNGYDFMLESVFETVKDMEDFLEQLEVKFRILDKKAYYIIEELKRECFLANPDRIF
ncbi:Lrp/AsnC family transcriptional regulator [Candidatus Woesearchaeota archaeon]|nr:MAG: Lrp/AsnC family transcriptional regulator [Candidatus Woesearchaeota archaeon]